jgi:hypothetical protein
MWELYAMWTWFAAFFAASLAAARMSTPGLASLATFAVGGGEVTLSRVTPQRLRTPLSRALSAGPRLVGD